MAVTYTQTDADNVKAALVSGAMEVTVGDRTVKYRSQKDLISLLAEIVAYLDGNSTSIDDNPSVIQSTFSRGES